MSRIGRFQTTLSGIHFYPLDPRAEDINIKDIARSLANTCRYGGHVPKFYSVAQHSILCAQQIVDDDVLRKWALMHDASEAYIGDIPIPIKAHTCMKVHPSHQPWTMETHIENVEDMIHYRIAQRFGLPFFDKKDECSPWSRVDLVDKTMLLTEAKSFFRDERWKEWPYYKDWGLRPLKFCIEPWTPEQSYEKFLSLFYNLFGLDA